MHNGLRIRLECGIAINVREHGDVGVGAFLQQAGECNSVFRPPIDCKGGGAEALELRPVVLCADGSFDGRGMSVSERMSMVGCEEVMGDAARVEAILGEPRPHPLTVARHEMVRPAIRPDVDAVKMRTQLLEMENSEPYVQHEVIIVGIGFWAVTEGVEVVSHEFLVVQVLHHHNAILHNGVILRVTDFRSEIDRSEIHQH